MLQGERRPGLGLQRRLRALPRRRRHLPRRRRPAGARGGGSRSPRAFAADASVVKVQFADGGDRRRGPLDRPASSRRRTCRCPTATSVAKSSSQPFDLVWMPTSANSFRLEAMRRVMPIPEQEYRMCAERYLVHLIALLGPVVSLDEVGAYYRVHGDNAYESLNPQLNLDRLRADDPRRAIDRGRAAARGGGDRPRPPGRDPLRRRPRQPDDLAATGAGRAPGRRRTAGARC